MVVIDPIHLQNPMKDILCYAAVENIKLMAMEMS